MPSALSLPARTPSFDRSRPRRGHELMATTTHDPDLILRDGEVPSLADRAYVRLREEIITAEVAPGTLLREEELTGRLGLGRTPIREAIQRLRREGYVTILPRRGTLVSEISITDLAAIY